jgi:hypothetical protein
MDGRERTRMSGPRIAFEIAFRITAGISILIHFVRHLQGQ